MLGLGMFVAVALFCLATTSTAQAATLSGTVGGQQVGQPIEPLSGAEVSVLDQATQEAVASTVTGALGEYSVDAPPGIFDVRFVPAPGQEYDSTTVDDVDLTSSRTLDVILVDSSTVRLTGLLRDAQGDPVPGARVWLKGKAAQASASTAADGSYSIAVPPGSYELSANHGSEAQQQQLPQAWDVRLGTIDMSVDRVRDIDLPATSTLTVEVLGGGDAPIPDAVVKPPSLRGATEAEELGIELASVGLPTGPTDQSGRRSWIVFTGGEQISDVVGTVKPPAESGYLETTFTVPRVDQDTTVVVRFQGSEEPDTEPPVLSIELAPDGLNDWFVGSPALALARASAPDIASLSCSVDGAPATEIGPEGGGEELELEVPVAGEGRHAVACEASDGTGNTSEATAPVLIDLTPPPPPALSPDRAPDHVGEADWYLDQVTVSATGAADPPLGDGSPGSGLDPLGLPAPVSFATSGAHVATAGSRDLAGNESAVASLTVWVDASPPASALSCPTEVELNALAEAEWSDADGESGLVGPSAGTQSLETGVVGPHVATHEARDRVGHATTSKCAYQVVYPYLPDEKLEPPPALNPRPGKKPLLPVVFSLGGDYGLEVFRSGFPAVQPIDCADGSPTEPSYPADEAKPLAFNAGRESYEYWWDLRSVPAEGCYSLLLGFDDGTTAEIWFQL